MDISVIVPVYNVESYLKGCLDSVLKQDFDSFEVVAVNDGSTDGCAQILSAYAEKDARVQVVTQENQGLGGARNTGIKYATGKYVMFLDSDDSLKEGTLSELFDAIEKAQADMVCFAMDYVSEDGRVLSTLKPYTGGSAVFTQDEYPLLYADDSSVANKMFKKDLFTKNNITFPQRAWYEDLRTLPKLVLKADKMLLTDKAYYNYLQREGSIMHNPNLERNIEMVDTIQEVLNYYKQCGAFEKYYADLEYMTILHLAVLATLRVASYDPKHALLKTFHTFLEENFPNYTENKKVKTNFDWKRKLMFWFSSHKMYRMLWLLNKLNELRK